MRQASTPVRIPKETDRYIQMFADKKQWTKVTALANIINASPIYLDFVNKCKLSEDR